MRFRVWVWGFRDSCSHLVPLLLLPTPPALLLLPRSTAPSETANVAARERRRSKERGGGNGGEEALVSPRTPPPFSSASLLAPPSSLLLSPRSSSSPLLSPLLQYGSGQWGHRGPSRVAWCGRGRDGQGDYQALSCPVQTGCTRSFATTEKNGHSPPPKTGCTPIQTGCTPIQTGCTRTPLPPTKRLRAVSPQSTLRCNQSRLPSKPGSRHRTWLPSPRRSSLPPKPATYIRHGLFDATKTRLFTTTNTGCSTPAPPPAATEEEERGVRREEGGERSERRREEKRREEEEGGERREEKEVRRGEGGKRRERRREVEQARIFSLQACKLTLRRREVEPARRFFTTPRSLSSPTLPRPFLTPPPPD